MKEEIPSQRLENTESQELKKIYEEGDAILEFFDLEWQDLKEKLVLDIGSGHGEFVQTARAQGVHAFGIDTWHPDDSREIDEWSAEQVSASSNEGLSNANAKNVPFPDETFDRLFAHASVPLMGRPTDEDLVNYISEMKRLIKTEGEIRFGPCPINFEEGYERSRDVQVQFGKLFPDTEIIPSKTREGMGYIIIKK